MDESIAWALGTWAALDVPFWYITLGTKFLCEQRGWGKKIQKGKEPSAELVANTWVSVAVDNIILHPAICFGLGRYMPTWGVGSFGPLPGVMFALAQIAAFLFIADTFFYATHRLLHHPILYKRFHKQHHEYHTCVCISAEYAHPFEVVFSNITPFIAGPCLSALAGVPVHFVVWATYTVMYIWETVDAHSGYELPWGLRYPGSNALRHDWHHSHNNGNFGTFICFWDWVLDTDAWGKAQERLQSKQEAKKSDPTADAGGSTRSPAMILAGKENVGAARSARARKSPRRVHEAKAD